MAEFRSVSLHEPDYDDIDELRKQLIEEGYESSGVRVKLSMAETIKLAVAFYKQRRKMVEQKNES